ncbi:MAG: type 1 periplasmic binding fold superfamily protein [Flavobacteriaceae bacterium]
MKHFKLFFLLTAGIFAFSCSDDDEGPQIVNEEEVITTLTITLTPQGGGTSITLQSQDLDGDGPNAPVVNVSGNLGDFTTYEGSIELLNETENPAEDITEEVEEEAEEHQFFYTVTGSIDNVIYNDVDGNGNPVGLVFLLTTREPGAATLAVTLRHEPTKPNDGTASNAGGETDIAQTFSVTVE